MVNRIAHFLTSSPHAMPRPDHPKSQLATTIPPALHDAVRDFSEVSSIPIAKIVEDALRQYLRAMYWTTDEDAADEDEWKRP